VVRWWLGEGREMQRWREREAGGEWSGGGGAVTPAISGPGVGDAGTVFGAKLAELTSEARFGHPNWTGLMDGFRMSWAVPK
jgi:hypothetical protein